jgi:hypothetical protein
MNVAAAITLSDVIRLKSQWSMEFSQPLGLMERVRTNGLENFWSLFYVFYPRHLMLASSRFILFGYLSRGSWLG